MPSDEARAAFRNKYSPETPEAALHVLDRVIGEMQAAISRGDRVSPIWLQQRAGRLWAAWRVLSPNPPARERIAMKTDWYEFLRHAAGLDVHDAPAQTITRGSNQDRAAHAYSRDAQGYAGTWADWLAMPISERQEYEDGAACGDPAKRVVDPAAADAPRLARCAAFLETHSEAVPRYECPNGHRFVFFDSTEEGNFCPTCGAFCRILAVRG